MLLTDLPDDQLRQIFDAGQVERTIATFVWKQVSQTTKRVVPEGAKTYRCAMRCSSKLRALARPMGVSTRDIILSTATNGSPRALFEIRNERWVKRTKLLDPSEDKESLFRAAIASGNVEMVKLAVTMGFPVRVYIAARQAALLGVADVYTWLLKLQSFMDSGTLTYTFPHPVDRNDAHTLHLASPAEFQHIPAFADDWWKGLLDDAVKGGNLDIVKHAVSKVVQLLAGQLPHDDQGMFDDDDDLSDGEDHFNYMELVERAIEYDHEHILAWAVEKMPDASYNDYKAIYCAAVGHNFKTLKWLYDHKSDEWTIDAFRQVVLNARYSEDTYMFLLEHTNLQPAYCTMVTAIDNISGPDYEKMEYLHSKGCQKNIPEGYDRTDVYREAARFGGGRSVACIHWLHIRGYGIAGSKAIDSVLLNDDLVVLGTLLAIGLDFGASFLDSDDPTINLLLPGGSCEHNWDKCKVVKWARANGYHVRPYPLSND